MDIYRSAASDIFGNKRAEKWLDENSSQLPYEATTVAEAKKEIYKVLRAKKELK